MKSNHLRNIFGAAVMALSLILGLAASSAVQAQYPDNRNRQQQDDRYRQQQERDRQQQERNRNNDQWNQDRRRGRGWDGYPQWGGNYELRQTALNAGYNEGVKQARKDRGRNGGYGYGVDFGRFSSYRNASKDYNSRYGDKELYRRYFRMAFENGYADGLRGY